ncbi:MAG: DNA translocase FtsK [Bacteroidia bacterium]|nr:DNA translocase FtsK [Bacteroidia bacterium]MCZ2277066.1 DNA translocase FtsK [Bacteroidia bacterium]
MSDKGNKLKSKDTTETKTKLKKQNHTSTSLREFIFWFKEARFKRVSGVILFASSVFIFISLFSFFFTWRADYDKVTSGFWSLIFNSEIETENWFGKTGAYLSNSLFNNGFGLASLIIPFLLFYYAFRTVTGIWIWPHGKTIRYSIFALFLVSATLAYFFPANETFSPGGAFGQIINKWLIGIFGKVGTPLVLLTALTAFSVSVFNFNFNKNQNKVTADADPLLKEAIPANHMKDGPNPEIEIDNIMISQPLELEPETEINKITNPQKENYPETESLISEEFLKVDLFEAKEENTGNEEEMEIEIAANELPLTIEAPTDETPADTERLNEKLLQEFGEFDPKLDLGSYQVPPIDLLELHSSKSPLGREELMAELEANKNKIVETLGHYNIGIEKIKATVGPTVTLFEIIPKAGIRISKIKNLEDDIALSLAALGIRIIAPIPGKGTIGIEVPNQNAETVSMRTILTSEKFQQTGYDLPVALGKTISNEVFITDLTKMPHLLMAGATGQGKSVGLNALLVSLLYKKHPAEVKFVLVDPKKVELTLFKKIERHFLAKLPGEEEAIITDTRKVVNTLNSLCIEMDKRYDLLKDAQVRNIKEYNVKFVARKLNPNNGHAYLPYIILVIDEFADLIMTAGKEIETPIARLAQLARAVGIHLIIATQRPSVNIITGTIKANFPARIAFRVTSKIDSRTILDTGGADQLIGKGDMLLSLGADLIRLQCAFVDTPEVEKITSFIGSQRGYPDAFLLPEYVGEGDEAGLSGFDVSERDAMFEDAARIIVQHQQGSASLLQRKLKLGYNRAGRIIDQLEAAGIIGPFEGSKAREVKIKDMIALEQQLMSMQQS